MSYSEYRYRSSDGLELYYREYGAGDRTILCIPGLTRNSKDFEPLANHLAPHYRVLCPDLRGRGQSQHDPKPERYHQASYVRDMWRLLDQCGVDQVIVIGTSLGGLIAMVMADQQPARLRGVVLNDIGPEVPPAAVQRISQYAGRTPQAPDWATAVAQARQAYELAYPDETDAFWDRFASLYYRRNPDGSAQADMDPAVGTAMRRSQGQARWLGRLRRLGLLRRVQGVNIDPWDSFKAVTMPCLLLHGELSDVLTPEIVRRMQAARPGLDVVRVAGRGHAPTLDEAECREAIDRFLATLE